MKNNFFELAFEKFFAIVPTSIRNVGYLLAGDWLRRISSLIFISIVAKNLGPDNYGNYGLSQDYAFLFTTLLDMGFSAFLMKEIARCPNKVEYYCNNIFSIRLILSVPMLISGLISGVLLNYPDIFFVIFFLQFTWLAIDAIAGTYRKSLMALERMYIESSYFSIQSFSKLFLLLSLLFFQPNIYIFCFIDIFSTIIPFLYVMISFKKITKASLKFILNLNEWKLWFKELLPITFIQIIFALWNRLDTQFLIQYRGSFEVGIFSAVNRLVGLFFTVAMYIVVANIPQLSKYYIDDQNKFKKLAANQTKKNFFIGLAIGLFLCIFSNPIIQTIYGTEYTSGIPLLYLLAWKPLILGGVYSLIYILITGNHQTTAFFISGPCVLIWAISLIVVTPIFGFIGSGWTSLLFGFVWMALLFFATGRLKLLRIQDLFLS